MASPPDLLTPGHANTPRAQHSRSKCEASGAHFSLLPEFLWRSVLCDLLLRILNEEAKVASLA